MPAAIASAVVGSVVNRSQQKKGIEAAQRAQQAVPGALPVNVETPFGKISGLEELKVEGLGGFDNDFILKLTDRLDEVTGLSFDERQARVSDRLTKMRAISAPAEAQRLAELEATLTRLQPGATTLQQGQLEDFGLREGARQSLEALQTEDLVRQQDAQESIAIQNALNQNLQNQLNQTGALQSLAGTQQNVFNPERAKQQIIANQTAEAARARGDFVSGLANTAFGGGQSILGGFGGGLPTGGGVGGAIGQGVGGGGFQIPQGFNPNQFQPQTVPQNGTQFGSMFQPAPFLGGATPLPQMGSLRQKTTPGFGTGTLRSFV